MSHFVLSLYGEIEVDHTIVDRMVPTLGGRPHPDPAHWYYVKHAAEARDCHRCTNCDGTEQLEGHHRTYQRWGRERLDDVYTLCRPCHNAFHQTRRLAG